MDTPPAYDILLSLSSHVILLLDRHGLMLVILHSLTTHIKLTRSRTGAAIMVVFAEQLCVRRELREGIGSVAQQDEDEEQERIELGGVSID